MGSRHRGGGRVSVKSPTSFGAHISESGACWRQHRAGCGSCGSREGEAAGFYPMSPSLAGGWPFPSEKGTLIPWEHSFLPPNCVNQTRETPSRAPAASWGKWHFMGALEEQGVQRTLEGCSWQQGCGVRALGRARPLSAQGLGLLTGRSPRVSPCCLRRWPVWFPLSTWMSPVESRPWPPGVIGTLPTQTLLLLCPLLSQGSPEGRTMTLTSSKYVPSPRSRIRHSAGAPSLLGAQRSQCPRLRLWESQGPRQTGMAEHL